MKPLPCKGPVSLPAASALGAQPERPLWALAAHRRFFLVQAFELRLEIPVLVHDKGLVAGSMSFGVR